MENDLNISYSEIKFLERKRALLGGGLNSPPHTHTHVQRSIHELFIKLI